MSRGISVDSMASKITVHRRHIGFAERTPLGKLVCTSNTNVGATTSKFFTQVQPSARR